MRASTAVQRILVDSNAGTAAARKVGLATQLAAADIAERGPVFGRPALPITGAAMLGIVLEVDAS
jgi:uncharacterized membrane protein YdcZ (DUF606 family)